MIEGQKFIETNRIERKSENKIEIKVQIQKDLIEKGFKNTNRKGV